MLSPKGEALLHPVTDYSSCFPDEQPCFGCYSQLNLEFEDIHLSDRVDGHGTVYVSWTCCVCKYVNHYAPEPAVIVKLEQLQKPPIKKMRKDVTVFYWCMLIFLVLFAWLVASYTWR